ncbi:hypothetical protein TrRE_jg7199 [Triparma retinervis]|uniref:Prolyl 4-hydroxylase alpha subunit Fe(2+) 2OG dioxygenase domain-containing protein n=1 Tax=Triparma retinervis TaxID=2557542 RepID=A0A9W7KVD1_9STRA|nr:hypothetical protein TrRE_jg7199 [Triparma retinervis]
MEAYATEFDSLSIKRLEEYLKDDTKTPWETSMLYDSKKDAKFVDESLRSSSFRTFVKGDLFDVFDEEIMAAVNDPKQNPIAAMKTFTLVRSDISEIKYPVGGFFSKHKDYLSITSNSISEFTMIVALTGPDSSPPTVGGETLLHSAGHTLSSTKTTTPGGGLLFRKDIEHEGAKLEAGSKRILTVNLWAIEKAPNAGEGGVLLIEFPDSSPPASPTSSSNTNKRKLRELAKSETAKSYAIPINTVLSGPGKDSFFGGFVRFSLTSTGALDDNDDDDRTTRIVTYLCKDATFEDFAGIYKLMTNCRVSPAEAQSAGSLIKFWNFDTRALLVDLAHDDDAPKAATSYTSKMELVIKKEEMGWQHLNATEILGDYRVNGKDGALIPDRVTIGDFDWGQIQDGCEFVQEIGSYCLARASLEEASKIMRKLHGTDDDSSDEEDGAEELGDLAMLEKARMLVEESEPLLTCMARHVELLPIPNDEGEDEMTDVFLPNWYCAGYNGERGGVPSCYDLQDLERLIGNSYRPQDNGLKDAIEDEFYYVFAAMAHMSKDLIEEDLPEMLADIQSHITTLKATTTTGTATTTSTSSTTATSTSSTTAQPTASTTTAAPPTDSALGGDVIVCESEARTQVVDETVVKIGENYIKFRILLAEGGFYGVGDGFVGYEGTHSTAMRPLWVSVGDYDNVVGFTRVLGRGGGGSLISEGTDLTKVIDREKSTIDVDDPSAENSLVQLASSCVQHAWSLRQFSIAGVPPAVDAFSFYSQEFKDIKKEELFPGKTGEIYGRVSAGLREDWDRLTNRQKSKWTAMGETSATKEMTAKEHLLTAFGEALHTIHITDDEFEYEAGGGLQLNLKFSIEGFQKRKRAANGWQYEVEDPCDIERFEDDAWQTINALVQVGDGTNPTEGTRQGVELLRYLPCTPKTGDIKAGTKEDAEEDDGSSYFHRDSVGKTCFSAKEAERTTKRLAEMKFIDRILDEIKTTKFLLPQQDVEEAATYCNEQVYGNFTFLQVTGVVSLD